MPQNQNPKLYGVLSSSSVSGSLRGGELSAGLSIPQSRLETDYERLSNKPKINGVTLSGDMSLMDLRIVSENTTDGWNSNPQYLPKQGEICIYLDYATAQDDMGNIITYPGIKIGDGNSYLIDMPFVGAETRYILLERIREHELNTNIHVSPEEKEFWNNKLNYNITGEELVLTRN